MNRIKLLDSLEGKTEKEIKKIYKEVASEVKQEIAKYEEMGALTMEEMQKFNRLKALHNHIDVSLTQATRNNKSIIETGLTELYNEGYSFTQYTLEKGAEMTVGYIPLDPRVAQKTIMNDISGLDWIERLDLNRAKTLAGLKQDLAAGLINGEGYGAIASRMTERLGTDQANTMRIARTEGHRVREESAQDAREDLAELGLIVKKQWMATLDGSTRDEHRMLDGETVGIDEEFSNGLMFPGDPRGDPADIINCRCTIKEVIEGIEPDVVRRGYRAEDGQWQVADFKDLNYEDWKQGKQIREG